MLVTDRFTECLKSLYLNEFPCHDKPISASDRVKRSAFLKKEISSINDIYEIEGLLDLIKDKKSPWYEVIEWTKDGDNIRQTYIKNPAKIDINFIEKYFVTLRLNDLQIEKIDKKLLNFINLKELVLNCNRITECDSSCLPDSIEIFDLTGNYLTDLRKLIRKPMLKLQHFGLGYNWIENLDGCFNSIYWPSIRSLDLQHNQFADLNQLIDDLSSLSKLKVLTLLGSPVTLLPGYRGLIIDNLPSLIALDDRVITREERISSQDFKLYSDCINKEAEIQMCILQLRNLIVPEQPEIEDNLPEINLYKYLIKFNGLEESSDLKSEENYRDFSQHGLHSLAYSNKEWKKNCTYKLKTESTQELEPAEHITFNESGIVKLKYSSLRQLRDFILDGTELEVIERKRYYQSKDYVPELVADAAKKKATKAKPEKEVDTKKSKAKKGNQTQLLTDNYNLISTDDKTLATFSLDTIASILDGHTKEIEKSFSFKVKVEPKIEIPSTATTGMNKGRRMSGDKKKSASIKGKESKLGNNLKIAEPAEQVEALPLELDVKFRLLDFQNFKDLKTHFDSDDQ